MERSCGASLARSASKSTAAPSWSYDFQPTSTIWLILAFEELVAVTEAGCVQGNLHTRTWAETSPALGPRSPSAALKELLPIG